MRNWSFLLGVCAVGFTAAAIQKAAYEPITADQKWESPYAKLELVGVCRASETDVSCWGPDRKPAKELTRKIKVAFEAKPTSLNVSFGKKTRIVILEATTGPYDAFRSHLSDIGSGKKSHELSTSMREQESGQGKEIAAYYITAANDQQTTSISSTITHTELPSDPVEFKVGAELTYLGSSYKIEGFVKAPLLSEVAVSSGEPRWVIALRVLGERHGEWPQFMPLQSGDIRIGAVNKSGSPIHIDGPTMERLPINAEWGGGGGVRGGVPPK
ncbi:MAG: hypothetical protein ABL962_17390, partial [Fimbriimonadaceae bacterium]